MSWGLEGTCCHSISSRKLSANADVKKISRSKIIITQNKHNEKAEWINYMTRELEELEVGPKAEKHTDFLKTTLKKLSNWKTPGHDGIHGFWFKKITSIHNSLALEMNKYLQSEWITKERIILIQKVPNKVTAPNIYRPMTCLPMMWKILTAQIREEIYYSLTSHGLFPDVQKGCRNDAEPQQNYFT